MGIELVRCTVMEDEDQSTREPLVVPDFSM
jgi:hypothetical protein